MTMCKIPACILIFVFALGVFTANAQMREVVIENTQLPNAIRDAIVADVMATDTATVNNTKYLLQRGETYVHDEQYETSHNIWLEAAPGDGPLPRILGISFGGEAPRAFRTSGNTTFIGLRYEGLDVDGNHTDNAPLRQRGDGTTMTAKDCIFPDHRHEIARVDGPNQKWFVENNIMPRNYRKNNWVFGYTFSFRDTYVDTFVIRNNTFYNTTGGLMHSDLTAGAAYMEFSKNTLYGVGGLYVDFIYVNQFEAAMINFGYAQNVVCKDNLIIDSMIWGYEPQWADSISVINVNLTDSTGTIDVSHNNIYRDPALLELNPETTETIKWFDPELASLIGEDGANFGFISENVEFNSVPTLVPLQDALVAYHASPTATQDIYLELATDPAAENVDLGYTAKRSPTASSTGGPLGAERWFDGVTVGVEDETPVVANSFKLHGNYPNPFNPSTAIRFDLQNNANVRVKVMNTLGQVVYESSETAMTSGPNKELQINAADWTSGMYLYQVIAQDAQTERVLSGRMLLLK